MNELTTTPPTLPEIPLLSRIQIERVYNLGNYEHIRYSLGFDVPAGECPHRIFRVAELIIKACQPCKPDYEENTAIAMLKGPVDDLSERHSHDTVEKWRKLRTRYRERAAKREAAIELLKTLGGTAKFKDAKQDWDDHLGDYDDTPW